MASLPAVSESPFVPCKAHSAHSALLAYLAETPRLTRVTPATRLEVRPAPELVSFGIAALDQLTGGLPRGCLTEISGPTSSGRTSVLLTTLAAATRRGETCALIDVTDSFHPHSGIAAGIDLSRLLWVRCTPISTAKTCGHSRSTTSGTELRKGFFTNDQRPAPNDRFLENPVEQALRAADLLLQSGGFGLIAIDLAGASVKIARRIPLTTWFRFRRAIEPTPTILLTINEQPCAQTCATLSLQLAGQKPLLLDSSSSLVIGRWSLAKKPLAAGTQHSAISIQSLKSQNSLLAARSSELEAQSSSHTHLLEGLRIEAELLHSRLERNPAQSTAEFPTHSADSSGRDGARPVSARPETQRIAPQTVHVFDLRANQLRAHG
jgi:hypothetical protein